MSTLPALPLLPIVGPAEHGVAAYAAAVAGAVALLAPSMNRPATETGARTHLHFTDRLFGASPDEAADAFEAFADRTATTVTLHDLPQSSDGERSFERRAEAYARVVSAAAGVVCNSGHEVELVHQFVAPRVRRRSVGQLRPMVIPLPVRGYDTSLRGPLGHGADVDAWATNIRQPWVAVLGYFYPGKGHTEIVDALARLGTDTSQPPRPPVPRRSRPAEHPRAVLPPLHLLALGGTSPGHDADFDDLVASAAAQNVGLTSTGFLPTAQLAEYAGRVAVPVAAHQHVSASGSVNWWVSAGRRPLVPRTRYFEEMAALRPDTLTLYDRPDLGDAIAAAWHDPRSTWLDPATDPGPSLDDVAAQYVSWWQNEVDW